MKVVKALVELGMARSGAEAQRMVKEGMVWAGGCITPCNPRRAPYTRCTCNGWHRAKLPTEDIPEITVLRVKDGNYRFMKRMDGQSGIDVVKGIGRVPLEV